MENSRTAINHSSTYGQACLQCYKAKCRCVPNASGSTCERCHRLRKRCQPSDSVRGRNARRAEESNSRIAQLEDKIETLISAMQSIVSSSGSSVTVDRLPSQENLSTSTSDLMDFQDIPTNTNSSGGGQPTPASDIAPMAPEYLLSISTPLSSIPRIQAEKRLEFFRSRMLPCFPFISLAPEITTQQLHQNRPFLFQAILTVTAFSTQRRLALAEDLKRILFTSALVNAHSSIDLLLGLLTYLAWSTDAFLGRADLTSRLMMLSISLVYDLRLFKPCQPDVQLFMTMTQGAAYESTLNTSEETVQSFMEKQRALLACFILSSNVSCHLGRQDALRWTSQMEEACRVIENNKSPPTDQAFGFQVRLHVLKQRATYIREQHEGDRPRTATASVTGSVPGLLYLKTMRRQLRELISSFPPDIHQREVLNTYVQYVEIYINQLTYSISFESPLLDVSGQRTSGGLLPGFERLECLWRSVECIKSWLDNFYKVPPSEVIGLPFHFWTQMIQCVTILKYLSTLDDPAWDCQAVRHTVDIISTMDCMVQKLGMASKEPGIQCDDNLFQLLSKLLNRCRAWAVAWYDFTPQLPDPGDRSSQNADITSVGHGNHVPDLDQIIWMQSMDLENDQWLESVMGASTAFS
ncbi:putative C6 transcription factor [Xylaria telfairii]|nr:putative C6 transcription factor [Xylaria telfairii]